MLDLKEIVEHKEEVKKALSKRAVDESTIDYIVELDKKRRDTLTELENLRHIRNEKSSEIGKLVLAKLDTSSLKEQMKEVSKRIKLLEDEIVKIEEGLTMPSQIYQIYLTNLFRLAWMKLQMSRLRDGER